MSRLGDLSRWRVEAHRGTASDLHGLGWPTPTATTVRVMGPGSGAVVNGTGRGRVELDEGVAADAGLEVATRSSGGGVVLLDGASSWVDVLVPRHDPAWDDDVSRSMTWLGRHWVDALARFGMDARVHAGAMVCGRWGKQVCFAGTAAGEVLVDGRKAVGISQRRTRDGARFQCVWYRDHDAALLSALVAPAVDDSEALEALLVESVATVAVDPDLLVGALVASLDRS